VGIMMVYEKWCCLMGRNHVVKKKTCRKRRVSRFCLYVFMVEVTGVFDCVDEFIDDESPINWKLPLASLCSMKLSLMAMCNEIFAQLQHMTQLDF
jgi:hypothetical protein